MTGKRRDINAKRSFFPVLFLLGIAAPSMAGEVVDLRDGARMVLYGSYDTKPPNAGDYYGWAMAFGDIDGDGYLDFLSSSANSDGPGDVTVSENDVYILFGGPRADFDSLYAVDSPGGIDIHCHKGGFAMACADIDNDGYDDAILAEYANSTVVNESGVFVIFGAPRDQLLPVYDFHPGRPTYTPPGIHIRGTRALGGGIVDGVSLDYAGPALVTGDFNGDGFADIAIGQPDRKARPGGPVVGALHLIFGRPRAEFPPVVDVRDDTQPSDSDVIIWGEVVDQYPFNLAVGDLDGDGMDDLIASSISASGEDNEKTVAGEVQGWWGKKEWMPVYETRIEQFDFVLEASPSLGFRMVTGDVDGDGRDDLILGNPFGDLETQREDRVNMGEYRVLFGRPRSLWPLWGDAVAMTDVLIRGAATGDALSLNGPFEWGPCFSFATGSRDGDRYEELVIGAGRATRPDDLSRTGAVYLLNGRPRSDWQPFYDLQDDYDQIMFGVDGCRSTVCTGTGGYGYDLFGYTTAMGDIDGDGYDEIMISAEFADGPDNAYGDAGEVYILFGDATEAPTADRARQSPTLARSTLSPNYPNPFVGSTTFRLQASRGVDVELAIYDVRGRLVSRPLERGMMATEELDVTWTGRDDAGRLLPSGVYFARLRAGDESHSRKVLLVR